MGIVRRQGIWLAIYTYIGIGLGYVNMVWLFPTLLSGDQFGLLRVIIAAAMLLSKFSEFGLSKTVIRYFTYFKKREEGHYGFLSFVLLVASISSALLVILFVLFKDLIFNLFGGQDASLSENFAFILLIALSMTFNEILSAYSRVNNLAVFPIFSKETLLRLLQLGCILFYWHGMLPFDLFLIAFTLTYLLQALSVALYIEFKGFLIAPFKVLVAKILSIKDMVSYSFFMFLNKVPAMTLNQIDVLMLGILAGLTEAGTYAIAYFIANAIKVPARSIGQMSSPLIAEAWKLGNYEKISKMYYQTAINQLLIGGLFLVLILVNLDDLTFFLSDEYQNLYIVVLLVGLSKLFDMATGINGIIISTSRYFKFTLYSNLGLLGLAVLTNYIFIPIYGITGAALATALSVLLTNALKYFFVWFKLKMQPFRSNTLVGLLLLCLLFILGEVLPIAEIVIVDIALRSVVILGIFLPVVYFFNISEEIKETIDIGLRRMRKMF